jgi:hypothetical protein
MYFNDESMNIDRNNYETYFLNYLDEELKPTDRQAVEKFLYENADLQKEFAILQQTILNPAEIIFDRKELLFREEKKIRIVPFYRVRMVAAVALLVAGSWFIKTVVLKNRASEITRKGQIVTANIEKKSSSRGVSENSKDMNQNLDRGTAANNNQLNSKSSDQSVAIVPGKKNKKDPEGKKDPGSRRDQQNPQKNQDRQQPQSNPVPEESLVAVQKSNASAELQSNGTPSGNDPKLITALSGSPSPALILPASNSKNALNNESALLKDSDAQTDNAISVVALNESNKSITGLFKKLTKRAPADDNTRKVRVSVFQINY